jgi:tetratricopeptide (TPR) repeat protein
MREALAVQSFEAALEVVTIEDMPSEYAMLQNNLGNALQYASSSHAVQNNLRALEAYDQALKVREYRIAPVAYANTIANKANCLCNLPDDPHNPEQGNRGRVALAKALYKEAICIFEEHGELAKAHMLKTTLEEMTLLCSTNGD